MDEQDITSEKQVERDEKGRILPGNTANPNGRPKGTVSIMTKIKQYLADNPEKLEDLVQYYLNDEKMRGLLLQMIDGKPPQDLNVGSNPELPFKIIIEKPDGKES